MIHNSNYESISLICSCTVRCISTWLSCINISRHNLQHFCRHTSQVHLQPLLPQAVSSRQEPRTLFLHPVSNRSLQQLVSVVGPGDRLSRCQPGTLHAYSTFTTGRTTSYDRSTSKKSGKSYDKRKSNMRSFFIVDTT